MSNTSDILQRREEAIAASTLAETELHEAEQALSKAEEAWSSAIQKYRAAHKQVLLNGGYSPVTPS